MSPPAIGAVAGAVMAGLSAASTLGTIGGILVGIVSFGLSMASQFLQPKFTPPKFERMEGFRTMIRTSTAPHVIVYGETEVSGVLVAAFNSGNDNKFLHLVLIVAGHEIEAIGDVYIGDLLFTDPKISSLVRVKKHLGSSTQIADSDLVSEIAEWTTDHRLRGRAYVYVRLEWDADIWLTGIPNIRAKIKGKKVYDTRTAITAWSDNAALCQLDYLMDESYGMGVSLSKIDTSLVNAAANICDETVDLADSAAGTEKRYTCNGAFTVDQLPKDIFLGLLTSSAGFMFYQGGKYKLFAGAWNTPTVTIDESDMRQDPLQLQDEQDTKDIFNTIKGTFLDSSKNHIISEFSPVTNSQYVADDGGKEIVRDVELPFTASSPMAQRLAKIMLNNARRDKMVIFPAKLKLFPVSPGDVVNLNIERFGWSNKTFRVTDWTLNEDLGIDLKLKEEDVNVWGWVTEEQTLPTPPTPPLPDPTVVATPTGLTVTSEPLSQSEPDGTGRFLTQWDMPTDELVLSGGFHEVEFKASADTDWNTATITSGDKNFAYVVSVQDGVNYDVRVRAANQFGVKSAWATLTGTTANLLDNTLAGNNIIYRQDNYVTSNSTSYVKVKEIYVGRKGTFRIVFGLRRTNWAGGTVYGRIYRNGSAVGTIRSTSSTSEVTFSEDISGWVVGDLMQLYIHTGASATNVINETFEVRGNQFRSTFKSNLKLPTVLSTEVGDIITYSDNTVVSKNTSGWTKFKECQLGRGGKIRVKYSAWREGAGGTVEIRKNETTVLVSRGLSTSETTWTDDFSGLAAGDKISFWLNTTSGNMVRGRTFEVKIDLEYSTSAVLVA